MERGNSTIKKILSDVCAERKKEGKSDNWVLCLGRIMSGLNTHRGQMANAVSSYRTLFGCDYHRITSSTLQDARECKTVKDIVPLIMDDGQFAQYVKTNYDIDAEPTKTADQELNEDLNYWEYDEVERIMLKANPKEFVNSYSNENCKEAAAGRTGLNEDSEDGEEDEEEEMLLENQPLKSEEAEWDLKQATSIDGELKGFMEPSTYATVTQDGPTQELNSSSKELFPKDRDVTDRDVTKNNKLSPTTIVRKLIQSSSNRLNPSGDVLCPTSVSFLVSIARNVTLIATSVVTTRNTLMPIQRTRGDMTPNSSTSFQGWCVM